MSGELERLGQVWALSKKYPLTMQLLRFWKDAERGRWTGMDAMKLLKTDGQREALGIPSFLA